MSYNMQKDFSLIFNLEEKNAQMQELLAVMSEAREIGGTDDLFEELHDMAEHMMKDIAANIYPEKSDDE